MAEQPDVVELNDLQYRTLERAHAEFADLQRQTKASGKHLGELCVVLAGDGYTLDIDEAGKMTLTGAAKEVAGG